MKEKASTDTNSLPEEIQKEAVDALVAETDDNERRNTFDYFQSLVDFQKHAANARRS